MFKNYFIAIFIFALLIIPEMTNVKADDQIASISNNETDGEYLVHQGEYYDPDLGATMSLETNVDRVSIYYKSSGDFFAEFLV